MRTGQVFVQAVGREPPAASRMDRSRAIVWRTAFGILTIAVLVAVQAPAATAGRQAGPPGQASPRSYYCVFHPEVSSSSPGNCRKCGDPLVAGDPWAQREYLVDLRTTPAAPKAGVPIRFRVAILDPDSRETVHDFAVLQEKRLHLFVVSQDLTEFAHLHPEQQADGSWIVDHTLKHPGYFRVFTDFAPYAGTPQVLGRTLVTAGHSGDLETSIPRLRADQPLVRTVGDTTVRLVVEPPEIIAGHTVRLQYEFSAGGAPVTDLEPYLSGWAYGVAFSQDGLEHVRSHALEAPPADVADPRGGPTVRFDATFPRPGPYRIWTMFKRHGVVSTVPFTIEAVSPSAR
jgi:hypothetical protein